jgi:hypothetical protein
VAGYGSARQGEGILIVAIVGYREPKSVRDEDQEQVISLIRVLKRKYKPLTVISVGCDLGVGALVQKKVQEANIDFMEFRLHTFGSHFTREELNAAYAARNQSVIDLANEFHLFSGGKLSQLLETMSREAKKRVKASRVFTY